MRHLLILLSLVLTSCNLPAQDKLLFSIEKRNISEDRISEHRFFASGLVESTITHDSSNPDNLFQTQFHKSKSATELLDKLQALDYHNHFPWKEEFYKRGDVIKVQFPKFIESQTLKASDQAAQVLVNKTYYFYTGDEQAPEILNELLELMH